LGRHTLDPLFEGINLSGVSYYNDEDFSHPGIDLGATLLLRMEAEST